MDPQGTEWTVNGIVTDKREVDGRKEVEVEVWTENAAGSGRRPDRRSSCQRLARRSHDARAQRPTSRDPNRGDRCEHGACRPPEDGETIDGSEHLFGVEGKVVLVTGGSRGIGEMIAAGFLANGAKVYISSRKAAVCDATAARLTERYGSPCISLPADLSGLDGIDSSTAQLTEREERLDVLVNNAGVSWGAPIDNYPGEPAGTR